MFHHLVQTAQSVGQVVPAPKLIGQFLFSKAQETPAASTPAPAAAPAAAAGAKK